MQEQKDNNCEKTLKVLGAMIKTATVAGTVPDELMEKVAMQRLAKDLKSIRHDLRGLLFVYEDAERYASRIQT